MTDFRFDPQTRAFSAVRSNVRQSGDEMQLTAGPGAIVYGLDTGANLDGDGYQPQSIDAIIPTLETTTQLSASPGGTTAGQSVTFTAVVSSLNPVAGVDPLDGSVTLTIDGQLQSEIVPLGLVNGQDVATFTLTDLAIGAHDIVANYDGSQPPYTTFGASDSPGLPFTVVVIPTTTTVQANPSTADPGQPVTLVAYVSDDDQNAVVIPSGTSGFITFTIDGQPQAPMALSYSSGRPNAATLTLTTLGEGDHVVTAAYSGGGMFGPSSTDQPVDVTITGSALTATTTTLTASPSTADLGQPVTLTAVVASTGQTLPTGSVIFTVDEEPQAPSALSVNNGQDVATLVLDGLAIGHHIVSAEYSGDSSFAAGARIAADLMIDVPAPMPTTTTINALTTTADVGQPVTVTAVVGPQDPGADPTALAGESAQFTIDEGNTTVVPLQDIDGQEVATLTTAMLAAGGHIVSASFAGDSAFASSASSSVDVTINTPSPTQAPTITTLGAPQGAAVAGQPLSFTAIVSPEDPSVDPSSLAGGSVVFAIDGGAPITVPLQSVGGQEVAMLTTSSLAAGPHTVTASFAGDPDLASSTSSGATVIVAAPGPTPSSAPTATTSNPVQVNGPAATTDGPLVMSLQRFGYHSQPTVLVLTFNEGLDPATASNAANYRIVRLGPHAKSGYAIAIDRIAYDPAARTVSLHTLRRLNVHDRFELIVDGTSTHAVGDRALHALDGDKTGKAGSDYVGQIDWSAIAGPSLPGPRYAKAWGKLVASGVVGQRTHVVD